MTQVLLLLHVDILTDSHGAVILDASLADATEVVLLRLCVRLESWQCPIPTATCYNAGNHGGAVAHFV